MMGVFYMQCPPTYAYLGDIQPRCLLMSTCNLKCLLNFMGWQRIIQA